MLIVGERVDDGERRVGYARLERRESRRGTEGKEEYREETMKMICLTCGTESLPGVVRHHDAMQSEARGR